MTETTTPKGCGRDPRRRPLCWRNNVKPNGNQYPMCEICIDKLAPPVQSGHG